MSVLHSSLLVFLFIGKITSIWPPPHEIHLEDSANFIISEIFEDDNLLSDEDEMIPIKSTSDNKKYFKIHQIALLHNKRELQKLNRSIENHVKIKEYNFDLDEPIPWQGGFVDKDGNFIQPENEKVYYLNEMAKRLIDKKIKQKRQDEVEDTEKPLNYDYNNFKNEYEVEVQKSKNEKGTFNYTEIKEDENLKEAVDTIVDFKEPKNCTIEEKKGIGISAIKCIITDIKVAKSKNSILHLLEKILKISLIWFSVYIIIAIPCWCTRGWCCCCFCCKLCRPRETIDEAKRFYTQNPVGVFHTEDGEKIEYQPTTYEIYTQQRLEKALFNL